MLKTGNGEAVNGVEVKLSKGCLMLDHLVSGGTPAENESVATPSGCFLVASSWGLEPGYCKVQLPEKMR